jgi:hypothetical protein
MMTKFALRLPSDLKDAAKALSEIYFQENPTKNPEYYSGGKLGSINEAIIYLTRRGLRDTLNVIDINISAAKHRHGLWEEMMKYIINNPEADEISPDILAESPETRALVEELVQSNALLDGLDPKKVTGGLKRAFVADRFATSQHGLFKLVEARGVIQKAVSRGY